MSLCYVRRGDSRVRDQGKTERQRIADCDGLGDEAGIGVCVTGIEMGVMILLGRLHPFSAIGNRSKISTLKIICGVNFKKFS